MSKKGANKKQNEKKGQNASNKKEKPLLPKGTILLILAILAALASFYVYRVVFVPPALPPLDLDEWWGPYPIDQKRDLSIRSFEIEFTDIFVNDLRERLLHRRPFMPPLQDSGFTYGFNSNFLTKVLDYWQNSYNFKERERYLNSFKHFKTNIQGLDVHFIHVKPKPEPGIQVIPLLMLHNWPSCFREFYDLIPLLSRPRPGYKFVFELVIPSLPGFGFSDAPSRPGFGPLQAACVLRNLMHRIGRPHYYVHDVGNGIGAVVTTAFPDEVQGLHVNGPKLMHPLAGLYTVLGSLWPSLVVEPELESRMYPLSSHVANFLEDTGYLHIQATKPDTIGLALTDSPAGLAAYILEKFSVWTHPENKRAWDGRLLDKYSLNDLLDVVMVYWVSNSITSSMRFHAESYSKKSLALKLDMIPTDVPTWGIKFKHDYYQPDSFLKLKYHNYQHSSVAEVGGSFAAMELPAILADDLFEATDTFIDYHRLHSNQDEDLQGDPDTAESVYDFLVKDIHGNTVKLDKYKGNVLLIVNVASQCGLTDRNYEQLNELHDKYSKIGLRILAFPCNQFNGQEPGSNKQIQRFAQERGAKFDLFEKVHVNGEKTHPLWKYLKRTQSTFGEFIKWNFSKFLIDRFGVPRERFSPTTDPIDIEPSIQKYL